MNSIKLPPIVQVSMYSPGYSEDLLSGKNDDISALPGMLLFNSSMPDFTQTGKPETFTIEKECGTSSKPYRMLKKMHVLKGQVNTNENCCLYCPLCNCPLSHNGNLTASLKHIPFGGEYTEVFVSRARYVCSNEKCTYFWDERIPFKAADHFLTVSAENYAMDLLRLGHTLKDVSIITGIGKNVVKAIDKKRLEKLYTVDGEGKELTRPTETVRHLGIDEFLLHKGHKYATIIMDLDTGHVLYLAHGKKKQVVYDFIEWIGIDWLKNVEALACDMNSDYEEAFHEKCPWIKTVFDRFHLIKNFNDKVIAEVRKDEQKRLIAEGNIEAAKALKGAKYIMQSSATTRAERSADAREGKVIQESGGLFNRPEVKRKRDYESEYEKLIKENKLFFTIDLIKEKLEKAYNAQTERSMKIHINRIIRLCNETDNTHFKWFARLLENHKEGIINYAVFHISSGKVEGTNNMIKTLRRKGYGYDDDDYFFLKIIDASHRYS